MTPDQEVVAFHYEVGLAVSQWSILENMLSVLMTTFFRFDKLKDRESLALGFASLEGFRMKLKFADGVIARKLAGSPHADDWKRIADRARTLSLKRNHLVHWALNSDLDRAPGKRIVLASWTRLKKVKVTKRPQPPKESLSRQQIEQLRHNVLALTIEMENFTLRICGQPEPHPKSAEQAVRPMTNQNLVRQIREVFAVQPSPSPKKPK